MKKTKIKCISCDVGKRTYVDHDGSEVLEGYWIEHISSKMRSIFGWMWQIKCPECNKRTIIKIK